MKKRLLVLSFIISTLAFSEEYQKNDMAFSIGLGVEAENSLYKTDDDYQLIPLIPINFRYNNFFIDTTDQKQELGYQLFSEDGMTLSLIGKFHMGYDSSDLEKKYQVMDDREYDFHIGLQSTYEYQNFEFISFITQDISGESDGKTLGMEGKVHLDLVPNKLIFTPSAGMMYVDSQFADYFYGIKGSEADKISGVDKYNGAGSMIYNIRGNFTYIYDENLTFTWINGVNFYDSKIKNSPIVDKGQEYYTGGMFIYKFR